MFIDKSVYHLAAFAELIQGALLVGAHEPTVADNIGR